MRAKLKFGASLLAFHCCGGRETPTDAAVRPRRLCVLQADACPLHHDEREGARASCLASLTRRPSAPLLLLRLPVGIWGVKEAASGLKYTPRGALGCVPAWGRGSQREDGASVKGKARLRSAL